MTGFLDVVEDGVMLSLRVSPGAAKTGIKELYGEDAIKIAVAAPPVEGRANAEVARYLAELLGVRKTQVEVVKGTSGRSKRVFVREVSPEAVHRTLLGYLS